MHARPMTTMIALLMAGSLAWSFPRPARAGVRVTPEAAWKGSMGLRVDVQEGCSGPETVVVTETVSGDETVTACKEVLVASGVGGGGSLHAVGGRRVVLSDGFQVATGGAFQAGTSGRSPDAVLETAPDGEPVLYVRLEVRLDDAGLLAGDSAALLALEGTRGELSTVWAEGPAIQGGPPTVRLEVVDETGARVRSPSVAVGTGWHALELRWDVGPAVTAGGEAELFVDGASQVLLGSLAIGQSLVDAVRVGAWDGTRGGGWIDFDEVAAARSGPIGPGE